jgi:cytochrome c oxidase subunit 2
VPALTVGGLLAMGILVTAAASVRSQDSDPSAQQVAALKEEGEALYSRDCASCHGAEGTSDGAGPALDGNTKLGNLDHVVLRILGGSPEKGMEAFGKTLRDHDIAAVATFVRNAWNNQYGGVTESDVSRLRATLPPMKSPNRP